MNIRQYVAPCVTLIILLGSVDLCAARSAYTSITFANETDVDLLAGDILVPKGKSVKASLRRGSVVVISDPQHLITLTSVNARGNGFKIKKQGSGAKQWLVTEGY